MNYTGYRLNIELSLSCAFEHFMEFAHNKCFIIIIIIIFIINVEKRIFVTKPQLKSYLQSTCCYKKSN